MPHRNVVVVGGSAGAIEALRVILPGLPMGLDASIFVVVHSQEGEGRNGLATVLGREVKLPCAYAEDGETIVPGRIYVACPGRHMVITRRRVRLVDGPRENGFRPAVDPLFRTAALNHGARAVGVVLSGARDDGAHGLAAIRAAGGRCIVQDPKDATFSPMPSAAIDRIEVDEVLPAVSIAAAIVARTAEEVAAAQEAPSTSEETASGGRDDDDPRTHRADAFVCPDCGGVLRELPDASMDRFQCRTGHAYSLESLLASQANGIEAALWSAVNVLQEREDMSRRLGARAMERGLRHAATRYAREAETSANQARTIRDVLKTAHSLPAGATRDEEE